jgi:hypothetical protein
MTTSFLFPRPPVINPEDRDGGSFARHPRRNNTRSRGRANNEVEQNEKARTLQKNRAHGRTADPNSNDKKRQR